MPKTARRITPGCPADTLGLGWVPGVTYHVGYWDKIDVCLGYNRHGGVIMRCYVTGVERAHMTTRSDRDTAYGAADGFPNLFTGR